MLPFCFSSL